MRLEAGDRGDPRQDVTKKPCFRPIGDKTLDRSRFTLTEKEAIVTDAPPGVGKLKGAVCSHDACHTLEKEVTIP